MMTHFPYILMFSEKIADKYMDSSQEMLFITRRLTKYYVHSWERYYVPKATALGTVRCSRPSRVRGKGAYAGSDKGSFYSQVRISDLWMDTHDQTGAGFCILCHL